MPRTSSCRFSFRHARRRQVEALGADHRFVVALALLFFIAAHRIEPGFLGLGFLDHLHVERRRRRHRLKHHLLADVLLAEIEGRGVGIAAFERRRPDVAAVEQPVEPIAAMRIIEQAAQHLGIVGLAALLLAAGVVLGALVGGVVRFEMIVRLGWLPRRPLLRTKTVRRETVPSPGSEVKLVMTNSPTG
jgi:hypothetical protein